eukprot:gene4268-7604_t
MSLRSASTVILVKKNVSIAKEAMSDYKILMLQRSAKSSFFASAYVFPGGATEEKEDSCEYWKDLFKKKYKKQLTPEDSSKITGIRELFEESGILLVDPEPTENFDSWREKIHDNAAEFKNLCEKRNFLPALDKLLPFSHWTTPIQEKKRFKTDFFFSCLEDETKFNIIHDGSENIKTQWLSPEEALSNFENGTIALAPPTWYTIKELSKFKKLENLVVHVKSKEYVKWQPTISKEDNHMIIALPGDKLHENSNQNEKDLHRILVKSKQNYELVKSKL